MWGTNLRQQGISWLHQNLAYSEYHKQLFLSEPSSKRPAKSWMYHNVWTIQSPIKPDFSLKKKKKKLIVDVNFYRGHPISQAIANRIKGIIPMASSSI